MQKGNEKANREKVGLLCLCLGALFILAGLVFFVLVNWINIYAKKVTATIMNSIEVTTSDGREMKSLELMYAVGSNTVTSYYTYGGELEDGTGFIQVYYDARNPKIIVEAGWNFEPIFLALLGLIVFLLGLYYKGITDFGIVEMKKPDENAPEIAKKTYQAREKAENGLFMSAGALVFVAFGLYMALAKHNPWMWIFVGIGVLSIVYFSLETVPAILELRQLKMAKKFKGTVVERDEDRTEEKNAEDKKSEKKSEKKDKKSADKKEDKKTAENKDTKD